jgi:hypothetical protein
VRAVADGPGSLVVRVTLEVTASRSVLHVRNPLSQALHYRAAVATGAQALRETHVLPVDAESDATEAWNEALAGLALYDLRLARAPWSPTYPPARPPVREQFAIGAAFGATWNSLDELNADLARHGFGAQRPLQPLAGMEMDVRAGKVAVTLDILLGLTRATEGKSPDVRQNWLALHAGHCVLCGRRFDVTPMLGIGWGRLVLDVDRDDLPLSIAGLDRLEEDTEVERSLGLLFGSVSTRYLLPVSRTLGLYLGVRAGYAWQFDQSGWAPAYSDDDFLRGGPEVDTSGFHVRLAVGFSGEL